MPSEIDQRVHLDFTPWTGFVSWYLLGRVFSADVDLAMVRPLKLLLAVEASVRLLTTMSALMGRASLLQLEELGAISTFVLNVGIAAFWLLHCFDVFLSGLFFEICVFNILFFFYTFFNFRILTFGPNWFGRLFSLRIMRRSGLLVFCFAIFFAGLFWSWNERILWAILLILFFFIHVFFFFFDFYRSRDFILCTRRTQIFLWSNILTIIFSIFRFLILFWLNKNFFEFYVGRFLYVIYSLSALAIIITAKTVVFTELDIRKIRYENIYDLAQLRYLFV